jgi:hypothetical protein
MDTLADKFYEWVSDQPSECGCKNLFKLYDHGELVWKFDEDATVNSISGRYNYGYDDRTQVIFSDGSELEFNYKGEG